MAFIFENLLPSPIKSIVCLPCEIEALSKNIFNSAGDPFSRFLAFPLLFEKAQIVHINDILLYPLQHQKGTFHLNMENRLFLGKPNG